MSRAGDRGHEAEAPLSATPADTPRDNHRKVPVTTDREQPAQRQAAPPAAPAEGPNTLVFGEPDGRKWMAWVLKRTYRIRNGRCELDSPGRQELLIDNEVPHDAKRKPPAASETASPRRVPRVSPPLFAGDIFPFRPKTDVVIQAFAHALEPDTRKLIASVRFGKHRREIAVFGDRFGDVDSHGRFRFTDPGPIEVVPIRYDYAYGGLDRAALAEHGNPIGDFIKAQRPHLPVMTDTPFHYPRNPCGLGYLMELSEKSFKGMLIPHLEYPDEPLWPQRLAVGEPERWIHAPLPAGWDWQSQGWFPRIAYIGLHADSDAEGKAPAEVKRGWAPKDILSIPPVYEAPEAPLRLEFSQGASPGMSVDDLSPGEMFELRNVHPNKPVYSFQMPGDVPSVQMELQPGVMSDVAVHLDSVVVRPVPGEVVVVWSARALVPAGLSPDQASELARRVTFRRPKEG